MAVAAPAQELFPRAYPKSVSLLPSSGMWPARLPASNSSFLIAEQPWLCGWPKLLVIPRVDRAHQILHTPLCIPCREPAQNLAHSHQTKERNRASTSHQANPRLK